MKSAVCRAIAVGELSQWGRQFLNSLQVHGLVDFQFETDLQKFLSTKSSNIPVTVFIEASSDSRESIRKVREAGKKAFIVWFGRSFAKDDLVFALDTRLYYVFENMKTEDTKIVTTLQNLSKAADAVVQFEQISRSLKGILLQAENEIPKAIMSEIKAAVAKLEHIGSSSELYGASVDSSETDSKSVPFHKSQTFSDALATVQSLERTGSLWVKGNLPGEEGRVDFLQGKIVSASAGEVHSLKAIYRMFMWDEVKFLFTRRDAKESHVNESIDAGLKYICLEGEGLKKRFDQIRRDLPPKELMIELEPSSLNAGTYLNAEEFHTLASVVEFNQIRKVLDYNPLPDVTIFESLIRLRKNKMIRVPT